MKPRALLVPAGVERDASQFFFEGRRIVASVASADNIARAERYRPVLPGGEEQ